MPRHAIFIVWVLFAATLALGAQPYRPASSAADPSTWSVTQWRSFAPAERSAFCAGVWTGLYVMRLLSDTPTLSSRVLYAYLEYVTSRDSAALEAMLRRYVDAAPPGAYFVDGLLAEPMRAQGLDFAR